VPPHRARTLATAVGLVLGTALGPAPATGHAAAGTTGAERTVGITAVEPRDDVFVIKGRVRPAYPDGQLVVQRKRPKAAHWHRWRTVETSARSRYRQRVRQLRRPGVVCYRVRVPGDEAYADAFSAQVCIRTFWK
jgi:hypothetical protein